MSLTLACALGVCLLGSWLPGSHCVFHGGHMGDIPVPSHLVLSHNPTKLYFFTVERRQ